MPTITKIEVQKNNKERFNIYLDGEYSFPVSLDVLALFDLTKNQELIDDQKEEILREELLNRLYNKVLGFISYRMRTKKEVTDRLSRYLYEDLPDENLRIKFHGEIMERIFSLNILDDSAFAHEFISSKIHSKISPGRMKLKEFLLKRGVSIDIIDNQLAFYSLEQETEGATQTAQKKLRTLKTKNSYTLKNKIWTFLAGRGYSTEAIRTAVDTCFKV